MLCLALRLPSCRLIRQICATCTAHSLTNAHVLPVACMTHSVREDGDHLLLDCTVALLQGLPSSWCLDHPSPKQCRLREDSPYLLLEEDAPAMHTELGVLSDANGLDEGPPDSSRHQQQPYGAGTESPGSVDRNFSLGDLEDEEDDQHMLKDQTSSSSKPQQSQQEQGIGPGRQASRPASSQSSSPRARDGASTPRGEPSRPKKPSGKKD